ncbi:PqqD family protein [Mesorhizobium sp. M4A.F.Ca.ET.022.05.2.1]|uniref:PqqD family protein n=1 Tax=Mesorhizobium sp. M4A.F.Ca.ET.022.05.2.1 TaxID=2496653 RepID=UPI001FE0004F|nr:PqqD family protein [Mesorhizobium sp. M4A.F.Ca.ET.022.05.2.1]
MLDLASGRYFGFSDTGSRIWQALSLGVPAPVLVGLAAGTATIGLVELESFIAQLIDFGLLAPAPDASAQPLPSGLPAELAASREPLKVDVHDDLADLIMVDPIHEVEEPLGWPAVKHAS